MAPRKRRVIWAESAQLALVLESALEAAKHLSTLAERGRVVPELKDPAVREVFVFCYRLMYRVAPDRVEVRAFVHVARDFADLRRNQDAP